MARQKRVNMCGRRQLSSPFPSHRERGLPGAPPRILPVLAQVDRRGNKAVTYKWWLRCACILMRVVEEPLTPPPTDSTVHRARTLTCNPPTSPPTHSLTPTSRQHTLLRPAFRRARHGRQQGVAAAPRELSPPPSPRPPVCICTRHQTVPCHSRGPRRIHRHRRHPVGVQLRLAQSDQHL